MLITPTTKAITTYALELDEADAAECLSSPYEFAERIGEQLRAAGATVVFNGNGHKPAADHPLGFKAHARKVKAGRAAKPVKAGRPNGKGLLKCPNCPKTFKSQGWLNSHQLKEHGPVSTASAAESALTE